MTTVLQVLAVWLVLSGLASVCVCLVLTGGRLHERRREAAERAAGLALLLGSAPEPGGALTDRPVSA